jgi:hypothetical protein
VPITIASYLVAIGIPPLAYKYEVRRQNERKDELELAPKSGNNSVERLFLRCSGRKVL